MSRSACRRAPVPGRGFTLLEVLVAMSIFAMIGLGAHQLLTSVIRARDRVEVSGQQLLELQRAMTLLERDLTQLVDRPIRDSYGDPRPALLVDGDSGLEFSRQGWRNPLGHPRSSIQRVAWEIKDDELVRHTWLVLDRAEDSEPRTQRVLSGVLDFRATVLEREQDQGRDWSESQLEDGSMVQPDLPPGIEILLETERFGTVRRLIKFVSSAPRESQAQNAGGQLDQGGEGDSEDDPATGDEGAAADQEGDQAE